MRLASNRSGFSLMEAIVYCAVLACAAQLVGSLLNALTQASAHVGTYEQAFRAWYLFSEDGMRAPCVATEWQKIEKKSCSWRSGGTTIAWRWEEQGGYARLIRTEGEHQDLVFLGRRAGEFVYVRRERAMIQIGLALPLGPSGAFETFFVVCNEGRIIL